MRRLLLSGLFFISQSVFSGEIAQLYEHGVFDTRWGDSMEEVKAVFPGVVAYARHFKGYGNMVVVDHGHDVYSLVAGLATIHARLDQRVAMGTRLGLAAPPTDEGNLYIEIRVGNTPEDPRRWLQLAEGGR